MPVHPSSDACAASAQDSAKTGEFQIASCAIVPTSANTDVAFVHDRMPVVLDGVAAEDAWLDPEVDLDAALEFVRPLPTDRTAPNFTLGTLSTKLKSVLTKGLRLTITSSERGTTTVTVTIDRSTARKLKLKRNAKAPVKVASLRTTVASGHTNLVVKLTAKARKALSKARTVKLRTTITVTDAGGNSTTHTRTITLKR